MASRKNNLTSKLNRLRRQRHNDLAKKQAAKDRHNAMVAAKRQMVMATAQTIMGEVRLEKTISK